MSLDTWALNGIVLAHLNRFAFAASRAGEQSGERVGALLGLMGNLTWAASPFGGGGREEEAGMALLGALLGSLGPDAGAQSGEPAALAALEREYISLHDQILEYVERKLSSERARCPSQVNRRVWELLFPQLPWGVSLVELSEAIQELLGQARQQQR